MRPSNVGGANWGGAAFDSQSGYLFVRATNYHFVTRVAPNDNSLAFLDADYSIDFVSGAGRSSGLDGLPLTRPPYGTLTAINLNKGDIAWQVPLGEGSPSLRNHPLLKGVTLPERLGSSNDRGGPLVTGGGLVFISGGDQYLYAFDKNTGRELWRGAIPFASAGNPMTYRTRSGRQFIVIA
jgi:quinoprotein glucose dehydrogenase